MAAVDVQDRPKVLLHDHLDGGLRPTTIVELADQIGHALPSGDPETLRAYFRAGADAGDILQYLDTFQHTLAVLQTEANLERVAAECVADLAADGVVYAEVRYAPELHGEAGLSLPAIAEAVDAGFRRGMAEAAADGRTILVNTIMCAMRMFDRSVEIAEFALASRDRGLGVVGFDLAGAETGFPPSDHIEAVEIAKRGLLGITIHASEPPGLELISDALGCGADRVGHGVRLIEDCGASGDGLALGPLAQYVLDHQVPLELAPSCNVQIGAVPTFADHPVDVFLREGFNVTVNTDNRLMSGVSVTSELEACVATFGWGPDELATVTRNALFASFASHADKLQIDRDHLT